jgi:CelD/BcsL family acetyltransferase involved in cellulose biosynthesis
VTAVEVIAPGELTEALAEQWRSLQRSDEPLRSPFLSPEFTRAVAEVRADVAIALVREATGRVVGFLPFQRDARGHGVPIGYPYSDRHGLIAAPGLALRGEEIVRGCGLPAFHFRYVPAHQPAFQPFVDAVRSSPAVEIDRFEPRRHEARRARKLAREHGPLRFDPDARSPEVLETLIAWKRSQSRRDGRPDPLPDGWIRALLASLLESRSPGFGAPLSALYAGDRLVAAHLGLASDSVWHWWFPSYDAELAPHSPGLLLLLEMLAHAPAAGIALLDFGFGPESFKQRFCTTLLPQVRGCVVPSRWRRSAWRLRRAVGSALRATRVDRMLRTPKVRPPARGA